MKQATIRSPIAGTVVAVNLSVGDSVSAGSATANITIVTDNATRALAVPTSAVHADNGQHSVTVLEGTTTRDIDVEIGAIGATWIEITEGLDSGEIVVLADLNEPLPGTATDSSGATQGGFPGGGQLPVGGRFPGGG